MNTDSKASRVNNVRAGLSAYLCHTAVALILCFYILTPNPPVPEGWDRSQVESENQFFFDLLFLPVAFVFLPTAAVWYSFRLRPCNLGLVGLSAVYIGVFLSFVFAKGQGWRGPVPKLLSVLEWVYTVGTLAALINFLRGLRSGQSGALPSRIHDGS